MTGNEKTALLGTVAFMLFVAWRNKGLLPAGLTPSLIMAAIGRIESGGRYDAIGPATDDGHRAYGKYQVMDFNVGPWSRLAIGRTLTPNEFLRDPAAQDAIVLWKINQLWLRWQNARDVAAVWFSGRPLAQSANNSDVTGTTVREYVDRVIAVL